MLVASQALEHGGLVAHLGVDGVDEDDGGLLARIEAAAIDRIAQQIPVGDAQALADGAAQVRFGVVQGELDFGQS